MPGYQRDLPRFTGFDAQVVGISVDSIFSHVAWQKYEIGRLDFPLCSDFYPHGEVARRFGVFREGVPYSGMSERTVFVVDKQGTIAFAKVYHLGQLPPNEDVFRVLEKLRVAA